MKEWGFPSGKSRAGNANRRGRECYEAWAANAKVVSFPTLRKVLGGKRRGSGRSRLASELFLQKPATAQGKKPRRRAKTAFSLWAEHSEERAILHRRKRGRQGPREFPTHEVLREQGGKITDSTTLERTSGELNVRDRHQADKGSNAGKEEAVSIFAQEKGFCSRGPFKSARGDGGRGASEVRGLAEAVERRTGMKKSTRELIINREGAQNRKNSAKQGLKTRVIRGRRKRSSGIASGRKDEQIATHRHIAG